MTAQIDPTTPPPKKNNWFGKIETREEALKIVKNISIGFYFVAALQLVLGFLLFGVYGIFDGIAFFVLTFLLHKFNSRAVAVILLLLSVAVLVSTAINKFTDGMGGRNIALAAIMIWASFRAFQATTKLKAWEKNNLSS